MKTRCADIRELVLTDVCPFTLGVAVYNPEEPRRHRMCPIIERNSVLPSSKENVFWTIRDRQRRVDVEVYQGEQPYCQDNTLLGKLSVPVPQGPAGSQQSVSGSATISTGFWRWNAGRPSRRNRPFCCKTRR